MSYLHEWRPDLAIKSSRTLAAWLAAIHLLFLLLLPFSTLALEWEIAVAGLVLWQWLHLHRRYALLTHKRAVRRVLWASDGWLLEDANGMRGPFRLSGASRVNRDFMLLHFRRGSLLPGGLFGESARVLVLKDNVGGERFHLLQIFLRWQRSEVLNPADGQMETDS